MYKKISFIRDQREKEYIKENNLLDEDNIFD